MVAYSEFEVGANGRNVPDGAADEQTFLLLDPPPVVAERTSLRRRAWLALALLVEARLAPALLGVA